MHDMKHKTIGVIAAMTAELEAIAELLTDTSTEKSGGLTFIRGRLHGQSAVIADCGIGPVNAAIVTQILIERYGAELIINTGIAGGLDPSLKPQSVVLADSLAYHDFSSEILEEFSPFTSVFHSDPTLLELAKQSVPADADVRIGRIVTGNSFVSSSELKDRIRSTVGGLVVDMESAAVAHTATVNGVPFLIVRSVSDSASDTAEEEYYENKPLSARAAAGIVSGIVDGFRKA